MTRQCLLCSIFGGLVFMVLGAALEFVLNLAHVPYALPWAAFVTGGMWGYWARFMQDQDREETPWA